MCILSYKWASCLFGNQNYPLDNIEMNEGRNSHRNQRLQEIKEKVLREVQLPDYYHMMFLKPFECILEENKGGLPKGLKIVDRKDDLKFQVRPIKPILSYQQFSALSPQEVKNLQQKHYQQTQQDRRYNNYLSYCKQNDGDNLLVQMKCCGEMEMAICVCMYNEDRGMMNNTLLGIGENIVKLYKKGVDPDKIVVIVVQDGIEKMDKSIEELMEVLQAESSIKFSQAKEKKLQAALKQISQIEQNIQNYSWTGEDTMIDLNCFLFSKEEEEKRKSLRFSSIKKDYDNIKKLYADIEKLKKDKTITHEDLPPRVLEVFKKECKKYILGDADTEEEDTPELLQKYYDQVSTDLNVSRPLVQNALTKMSLYCKQYIESRQQMSHVSFFRTSQFFPDDSGFSSAQLTELKQKSSRMIRVPDNNEEERSMLREEFDAKLSIKMNIFFVVKYKNAQKLSSHNWFFNGFCKEFSNISTPAQAPGRSPTRVYSPKYTILLDVGLRPEESALCKMYYTLENQNTTIGGVCGYMGLKIERTGEDQQRITEDLDFFTKIFLKFVDIQRAQQLEYHFAHLIDKGFESIFKFIHVLPGAFSGYNMKAIWGSETQNADKLLESYFKSIGQKVSNKKYYNVELSFWKILGRVILPNILVKCFINPKNQQKQTYEELMYESNVYLAEDRILCMGIHKNGYNLMFLPDAYSFVDPVKDIPAMLGQRKRWINGSYFAFEKVSDEFSEMGCFQCLNIQIWYLSIMNLLAYIAPGFFMFSISVAMQAFKADVLVRFFSDSLKQQSPIYNAFVFTINFIYAMLIFGLIYYSMNLTNRNKKFIRFVYGVSTILGVMSIIMMVILLVDLARGLGRSDSYLIGNPSRTFVDDIPGGKSTVDIIRYIMLGIMGLYAVPLMLYSICFRNLRVIFQVLAGALSFAFYTPTYLIILNIYALCRMDDLSWGTKGLDAGGENKDKAILDCWKIIKTIHVGKLVFWNVLVAGFLIHFGNNYLVRFYLTFALMVIIASTMCFKVLCGVLYYFYYLICVSNKKKARRNEAMYENNRGNRNNGGNGRGDAYRDNSGLNSIKPSLFKTLKGSGSENRNRTLLDQLNDQIKHNIETLNFLSGDEATMINMQLASFIQKGTRASTSQTKQFNSKINLMRSQIQKKSLEANKRFQKMRKQNPPMMMSPQIRSDRYETVESPEKSDKYSDTKLQMSENKELLSRPTNPFKGLFNANNSNIPSSNEEINVNVLPPLKKPTKQINFHMPMNK